MKKTYPLKHKPNEIVLTMRGVLKQAKSVKEYEAWVKNSEQRSKQENPYNE